MRFSEKICTIKETDRSVTRDTSAAALKKMAQILRKDQSFSISRKQSASL